MIKKYRKKPVEVEAIQWNGFNKEEIADFCNGSAVFTAVPRSKALARTGRRIYDLKIKTLEGIHHASINDFIIKGVHGEFYPCKPDIFEKTYEVAE